MTRLLTVLLFIGSHLCALEVDVRSPAAILINAKTGAVLFEKNSEAPHYPASITKIATALYLLECKGDALDEVATASANAIAAISPEEKCKRAFRCPSHWLEFGGCHIGLKRGEQMTLENLLYGLMLASANDAANVIAEHIHGSVPAFMEALNAYLASIGCRATHFTNPHGLHHPEHVTTARDMAELTRLALRHPVFCKVVASRIAERPTTNVQEGYTLVQYNKLVRPGRYHYPRAIGVKTGYTAAAGSTLVAAATEGDRTLIGVILGGESSAKRFEDAIALFDAAFAEERVPRRLLSAGAQSYTCTVPKARGKLRTYLEADLVHYCFPSEACALQGSLVWEPNLQAPIEKGEIVGKIQVVDVAGCQVATAPLCAAHSVRPKVTWQLKGLWSASRGLRSGVKGVALGLVVFSLVWMLRGNRR